MKSLGTLSFIHHIVPGWIKFVALFMLAFALCDVCIPESCMFEGLSAPSGGVQIQSDRYDGNGSTCQFEEDCLACAHFVPGVQYVLGTSRVVTLADPDVFLPAQDGISSVPYHPPRA